MKLVVELLAAERAEVGGSWFFLRANQRLFFIIQAILAVVAYRAFCAC